ncbi:hypothetical protein [Metaclostridioides mangenotii]|uniref:hypothetical protein n=1 Tax=Metaclostridioides mangenotii TaxID=1540 RepID=UPI00214A10F8|nr:hypothetical protein [Clostridioides mangenotii]
MKKSDRFKIISVTKHNNSSSNLFDMNNDRLTDINIFFIKNISLKKNSTYI